MPRNKPHPYPESVLAYIRQVFDARKVLPSDAQLAAETGIAIRMVRAIGYRERYKSSP